MQYQKLTIAAEVVEDLDISPMPSLKILREGASDWELLSDKINGFVHEPGIETEIEVSITPAAAPPPGASSLRYDLVRVISTSKR